MELLENLNIPPELFDKVSYALELSEEYEELVKDYSATFATEFRDMAIKVQDQYRLFLIEVEKDIVLYEKENDILLFTVRKKLNLVKRR